MSFSKLDLRVIENDSYLLLLPFAFNDGDLTHLIPTGFVTDFASIPFFMRWYCTGHGKSRKAAVVHDHLYRGGYTSRKAADKVFYRALIANGMRRSKARVLYWGVRVGGTSSYKGEK